MFGCTIKSYILIRLIVITSVVWYITNILKLAIFWLTISGYLVNIRQTENDCYGNIANTVDVICGCVSLYLSLTQYPVLRNKLMLARERERREGKRRWDIHDIIITLKISTMILQMIMLNAKIL